MSLGQTKNKTIERQHPDYRDIKKKKITDWDNLNPRKQAWIFL